MVITPIAFMLLASSGTLALTWGDDTTKESWFAKDPHSCWNLPASMEGEGESLTAGAAGATGAAGSCTSSMSSRAMGSCGAEGAACWGGGWAAEAWAWGSATGAAREARSSERSSRLVSAYAAPPLASSPP